MKIFLKLKKLLKEAVTSGKIYYTGAKLNQRFDYEFTGFLHMLNSEEQKSFEGKEKYFRAEISSKRINYGDFVCKGNISLQNVHILKKFSRDDYCYCDECSLLEFIRKQLNYIHPTIIAFFATKSHDNRNNVVTKDKLIQLWFNKRKKAIAIIKNSEEWPENVNVSITTNRNELYFESSIKYTSENNFKPEENRYFDREAVMNTIHRGDYFSLDELESIVKSCPNGKSCGVDGVFYEDLKKMFPNYGHVLTNILNIMLINQRISTSWKHSVIQLISKKNFTEEDLSTLRDISLLPTCYQILSKVLCKRIILYISNVVPFWQRAFLRKRDRQELIFTLKAEMDDFRHKSTKFIIVFIDFADAFGSVKHEFIFETLSRFGIPEKYACLIEDLYKHSTFKVICGADLTKLFFIIRGTKTGNPLSALIFILIINRICKPMINTATANSNLYNERNLNPIPVQAFADDIVTVHADPTFIQLMFESGERLMYSSGLDVKPSKCAVLYAR